MSNFIVSARKYRPQRFDEVVGQRHVSQTLKNALQSDHLAHAFLFCGPRGVGKTTCARILAKVLNCKNPGQDFEPCNHCDNCEAFNKNASFNITELDAASNNSVEHIRALIEQVRFQPQQGKYKVFIIDEVHMLSQSAFNAFLKTLEEPPSYAIFILATTEKHKIIPTILSRCQIFDFRRIQSADIVEHLSHICQQESIQADHDALHTIAQKADGALRDALSIFDRIVASAGSKVTYEDVIANLNILDYDYYFRVVESLLIEDIANTLLLFDEVQRKGFDADLFINGLAQHLRDLLVAKDSQTLHLLDTGDNLRARYGTQAGMCPADFLLSAINLANECDLQFRFANNKRLHVELTLIKMASIGRVLQLSQQPVMSVPPEKKTVDLSAPSRTSPMLSTEPDPPAYTAPELGSPPPPQQEAPKASEAPAAPNVMQKAQLKDLKAQLRVERQQAKLNTTAEITIQAVQNAWDAYAAHTERDSLRMLMQQNCKLRLDQTTVTVLVGSQIARDMVREESQLTEYLRSTVKAPDLLIVTEIDPSMRKAEPVERPKPLSARDRYISMATQNPALEELRKSFDLMPDE